MISRQHFIVILRVTVRQTYFVLSNVAKILEQTFPVITSQLHGSEAEGPIAPYEKGMIGPSVSFPHSCDVITGKVYLIVLCAKPLLITSVRDFFVRNVLW